MMGDCFAKEKNKNQDPGNVNENQVEPRNTGIQSSKMAGGKRKLKSPPKESKKRKTNQTQNTKTGKKQAKEADTFTAIADNELKDETSRNHSAGSETSRSANKYDLRDTIRQQDARGSVDKLPEQDNGASRSDDRQKEIDQLNCELKEKEKKIEEKNRQIKDMQSSFDIQLKNRDKQISALKSEVASLSKEKDDLVIRVSAMAGARLMDNNPNVADLSDVNRPTKLAEKYTELYDNEWTDAFTELENSGLTDKQTVKLLLDVLITTYKVCKEYADSQLKGLHKSLFLEPNSAIPPDLNKQLKENRKRNHKLFLPQLQQMVGEKLRTLESMSSATLGGSSLKVYCDKCLELTWLMCIQDPPVHIDCNVQLRGKKLDKNRFKEYTQSGPLIDYVVWPVVYLQEGGAMLSKGTAQCTKSKEDTLEPLKVSGKYRTKVPVGSHTLPVGSTLEQMMNMKLDGKQEKKKSSTFNGAEHVHNNDGWTKF